MKKKKKKAPTRFAMTSARFNAHAVCNVSLEIFEIREFNAALRKLARRKAT